MILEDTTVFVEDVEVRGHIIDSLILPKILDCITAGGGTFRIKDIAIGQAPADSSYALLEVGARDESVLQRILAQIADHGASPTTLQDCQIVAADIDGTFPEGFYSTTNQRTEVRLAGRWVRVLDQGMDCAIAVEPQVHKARCLRISQVDRGDMIVVGHTGVRVFPEQRSRVRQTFEFMSSTVSTGKPKGTAIRQIARELARNKADGGKTLVVAGPAVIHDAAFRGRWKLVAGLGQGRMRGHRPVDGHQVSGPRFVPDRGAGDRRGTVCAHVGRRVGDAQRGWRRTGVTIMAAEILMCPPRFYGIEYEINPWMKRQCAADGSLAMRQWQTLRRRLEEQGAVVHCLPPMAGLPDLVFTANAALICRDIAIPGHFRHLERQAEEALFSAWLSNHGFRLEPLPEGIFFEGAGDALFCGDTLFAGYRIRSEIRGHREIGDRLQCRVIPLELVNQYYYHLDTCFCPLSPTMAIYYPPAFDDYGRKVLASLIDEPIPVSDQEAANFACNAVVLGRTVVTNTGCPRLHRDLTARGFLPVATRLTEFVKAGGSAKCLTLRLDGEDAAGWKHPRPTALQGQHADDGRIDV